MRLLANTPAALALMAAPCLLGLGCSEELIEPGEVVLTWGQEQSPWSEDPPAVRAVVEKQTEDGELTVVAESEAPLERFSLGKGGIGSFVVTGFDATDAPRVRARSLLMSPAGLAGLSVPLFVSRAGAFARPPGALGTDQGARPPAAVLGGRYLFVTGGVAGDEVQSDGYDLGTWAALHQPPVIGCPAPPCRIESLALVGDGLGLALGEKWGIWLDLITGESGDLAKPDGLPSFADVAGGKTIMAPDGAAYVVGATRATGPTAAVLRIAPTGEVTALTLSAAREAAAATWVAGRGLVVVGGGDATAAGVELLADGADAFVALPYPPDATRGAALAALDASTVARLGGRDGGAPAAAVEIALGCGTGCQPAPRPVGVEFDRAAAFVVGAGRILVVGDDGSGAVATLLLDDTGATTVPLREPRVDATAIELPTGHVALVGGARLDGTPASSVELYVE